MDVKDLPPITDDEIVGTWRIAADDAASHRASVCGGLLDVWLSRHGRP